LLLIKSIKKFSILFCLIGISCSKVYSVNNLYGTWSGIKENKKITINFKEDATFTFTIKDKIAGIEDGFSGVYILDFSKSPIPLSFKKIQELNHSFYSIIEFIDTDIIKFGSLTANERVRSIAFDRNKHTILKRLK
tara:strand:- start:1326 stop:1733 length:408 start_codon:yes stop_codon:yes gene_type:complete